LEANNILLANRILGLSTIVSFSAPVPAIVAIFLCAVLVIPNAVRNLQFAVIAAHKKYSHSIGQPLLLLNFYLANATKQNRVGITEFQIKIVVVEENKKAKREDYFPKVVLSKSFS